MLIDDMIALMEPGIKLTPIVPKLFLSGRKLNITLVFMSQFCLTNSYKYKNKRDTSS